MSEAMLELVLSKTAMVSVGVVLAVMLFRYFAEPFSPGATLAQRITMLRGFPVARARPVGDAQRSKGTPWRYLIALFLLSRALVYLIALCGAAYRGDLSSFLANPNAFFVRWDAPHYMGLADNGYLTEGDARFHLVFYPLYPFVVSCIKPLFFGNTVMAGTTVSLVSLFFAGVLLYHLVRLDYGDEAGRRAAKYLMFFPSSVFFSIPYSESLFVLILIATVYLARRRKMALALLTGALASSARMLGLCVAIPIFLEFLKIAREKSTARGTRFAFARYAGGYALLTCLVAGGFFAYLYLNYRVTGDPFKFLYYQSSHWSQEFGNLGDTVKTTLWHMLNSKDGYLYGVWFPQLVSIFLVLILFFLTLNRINPGDGAFAIVYFYVALSPTWLLSGVRYIMAMVALYPMMALITKKAWQDRIMTCACVLGNVYFTYVFAILGTMY